MKMTLETTPQPETFAPGDRVTFRGGKAGGVVVGVSAMCTAAKLPSVLVKSRLGATGWVQFWWRPEELARTMEETA